MSTLRELDFDECADLLGGGEVGRVAVGTPAGPHIIPVNYLFVDDDIVVRTSPHSVLGAYGDGSNVAFEVDDFDRAHRSGWSVVVRGKARLVTDQGEVVRLSHAWHSEPWAEGTRELMLRIPLSHLSGRRLTSPQPAEAVAR